MPNRNSATPARFKYVWMPVGFSSALLIAVFVAFAFYLVNLNGIALAQLVDSGFKRYIDEGNSFRVAEGLEMLARSGQIECANIFVKDTMVSTSTDGESCEPGRSRIGVPALEISSKTNADLRIRIVPKVNALLLGSLTLLFSLSTLCFLIVLAGIGYYWKEFERQRNLILSEKVQFANQIAHDLRTPLAALDASLELETGSAELVRAATGRVRDIIRLLADQRQFKQSGTRELGEIVSDVVSEWEVRIKKEQLPISISCSRSRSHLTEDKFDEVSVYRIVNNIIQNVLEIGASKVIHIAVELGDKTNPLTISDNGPGLPEEVKLNLFQSPTSVGKPSGTGQGLMIIKKLADELGWNIAVSSDERGTKFKFIKGSKSNV